MTSIRLGVAATPAVRNRWQALGFAENPFPASGVSGHVFYKAHLTEPIEQIEQWLSAAVDLKTSSWEPLAVSGSIGAGKSHLLHEMERTLRSQPPDPTHGVILTSMLQTAGAGMKTLLLSELLASGLASATTPAGRGSSTPIDDLVVRIVERCQADSNVEKRVAEDASYVRNPLTRITQANGAERARLIQKFSLWLLQREITRKEAEELGVRPKLPEEGAAVRALAHFCRAAHLAGVLRTWVVCLDQLEDLWRPNVTTELRRARFLTDLRSLVDEGFAGAPIALALAWNVEPDLNPETKLKQQYVALFSRIRKLAKLNGLNPKQLVPFAKEYVDEARKRFAAEHPAQTPTAEYAAAKFMSVLERDRSNIETRLLPEDRQGVLTMPRGWLAALRDWADEYAKHPT
ncbi:MAG: hypothetical protein Q8O67_11825 [Deltaproteobacteria bacterium]|nr:hypothetical protein [Deltaproteobacteria bacterium]